MGRNSNLSENVPIVANKLFSDTASPSHVNNTVGLNKQFFNQVALGKTNRISFNKTSTIAETSAEHLHTLQIKKDSKNTFEYQHDIRIIGKMDTLVEETIKIAN
jgi:uncharacterized protein YozE (UPF0346 family)